jgi:hypothetical protein
MLNDQRVFPIKETNMTEKPSFGKGALAKSHRNQ